MERNRNGDGDGDGKTKRGCGYETIDTSDNIATLHS